MGFKSCRLKTGTADELLDGFLKREVVAFAQVFQSVARPTIAGVALPTPGVILVLEQREGSLIVPPMEWTGASKPSRRPGQTDAFSSQKRGEIRSGLQF